MASVTTINAAHPPSFFNVDLYPIQENSDATHSQPAFRQRTSSIVRPSTSGSAFPAYPIHPGSMASSPSRFQDRSSESFHTTLNRPRKLSQTGATSESAKSAIDSPSIRPRSSSWGVGLGVFEQTGTRRRSYLTHPPAPMAAPKRVIKPNEVFSSLPNEVLELILEWVKALHLGKSSTSCATCWMRDLCNLSLCSRRWYSLARVALYDDIQLVGPDSAVHKKKLKLHQGSRMLLLRRTLRANPEIAVLVRSLKVPRAEAPINWSVSKGFSWLEQYEDSIAALVMACPNLERLSGQSSNYDHSFKRVFHALSTRAQLKDMTWILDAVASQPQRADSPSSKHSGSRLLESLSPQQESSFLDCHRNWSTLSKLSILCQPGASMAPHTLLLRTLTCLPALQHLHLCNLPSNAFRNENLVTLPPLKTLILSNVSGITSGGLSSFATLPNTASLERLDLRHTPLTSLPALARILSNIPSLKVFSLLQSFPPVMPETDAFCLWMMPYLASSSITKLHWDITSHTTITNSADDILIKSIAAGGFPSLTTLRTPNDPEGRFQSLCRPVDQIALSMDRFHTITSGMATSQSFSVPSSPIYPLHKSATTMSLQSSNSLTSIPSPGTDLRSARLAAQSRLERAQDAPRVRVNITSEDGQISQSYGMAGYIGTLGSKIHYHLLPDDGAAEELGGLADVSDTVGDGGESISANEEGCTGRWNVGDGVVADKKEKEKWWHTERGRWQKVEL